MELLLITAAEVSVPGVEASAFKCLLKEKKLHEISSFKEMLSRDPLLESHHQLLKVAEWIDKILGKATS